MLENDFIKLRALEPEDLEVLYEWENITSLWYYGNTLSPYSKLTLRQYLVDSQHQDIYQSHQLRLMIDSKNEESKTVGAVDLYEIDAFNGRAGIGILIAPEYQGKKFAKHSLQMIVDYAFDFLNLHQLYAYIAVDNEKSFTLFSKAGFEQVGIFRDWKRHHQHYKDVYFMQLINNGKL